MYDSGINALDLIESVRSEADISPEITDSFLYRVINSVEQFIYTEILREYVSHNISYADIANDVIDLSTLPLPGGASEIIYDDVIRVFADSEEIERSGAVGVVQFPDKALYYTKFDGKLTLSIDFVPESITLIYRVRPFLKSETNNSRIALPVEFIELVAAKMRGEAYKVANEDGLAAKWLSDYNTQLESFKIWASERNDRYGG